MKIKENGQVLDMEFWGHTPMYEVESFEKKKLTSTDIMALRYAAIEIILNNKPNFELGDYSNLDDSNAIQDNSLYIGDFDGYYDYMNNMKFSCLEMSDDNRVIAVFETDDDDLKYFLVY